MNKRSDGEIRIWVLPFPPKSQAQYALFRWVRERRYLKSPTEKQIFRARKVMKQLKKTKLVRILSAQIPGSFPEWMLVSSCKIFWNLSPLRTSFKTRRCGEIRNDTFELHHPPFIFMEEYRTLNNSSWRNTSRVKLRRDLGYIQADVAYNHR